MEKVSIFVDVQNIYYTTMEAYGAHFDYNRFWARITPEREVLKAFAYAISRGDEKQKQFQNILRGIGFEVKLKPFIRRSDGSAKGDWDVGITIDVLEYAGVSDLVILATGDGDFDQLADKVVRDIGTPVHVYGVPGLTAASLKESASKFSPIKDDLLLKKRK